MAEKLEDTIAKKGQILLAHLFRINDDILTQKACQLLLLEEEEEEEE